ncbi:MAG: hypothetical protein KAJ19_08555 [Gammaproteobacteria bacterium]|nr:hypothetical protein [Gammaproteobacteria bacterium]
MSAATTLISANEVVNGGIVRPAPFNSRFDAQLLAPNLLLAEERFLVPILCRNFYEDLIAQKTTDASNYNSSVGPIVPKFGTNPDYETLWKQHLQESAARAVFISSLDDIVLQTGSNGLFINNSQFAESAGIEGMRTKEDRQLEKINLLINRMQRFLCKNNDLYPLWPYDKFCKQCGCSCTDECGCEDGDYIPKDGDGTNTGFVIMY